MQTQVRQTCCKAHLHQLKPGGTDRFALGGLEGQRRWRCSAGQRRVEGGGLEGESAVHAILTPTPGPGSLNSLRRSKYPHSAD